MKQLIFAFVVFFFSSAAFAFHCPADANAIDAGLAKASRYFNPLNRNPFPYHCSQGIASQRCVLPGVLQQEMGFLASWFNQ